MLNGFIYYDIVRNFWVKAYVYDEAAAKEEVRKLVEADKSLKGKSRVQLGLRPFNGTEIKSNLLGLEVVITQTNIAKMLELDNEGEIISNYKVRSKYEEAIKLDLHLHGTSKNEFGRPASLKPEFLVAFRIMLASIVTRGGRTDTISWPHKHFIFFMLHRVKINLAACLFEHLCSSITEGHQKSKLVIHHPRLISELMRQTKLIELLRTRTSEKLRVFNTLKFDAHNLLHMKIIKAPIIYPTDPLLEIYEQYFFCGGYPTISEVDNVEVIENFLEIFRRDTGLPVDRSMVAAIPD
jgi:hypothetical protein